MNRPVHTSPIIFSGPMVRGLLDSRKTQTRRLITSQWSNVKMHHDDCERVLLWVKEAWRPIERPADPRSEQEIPFNTWQVEDGRWLLYRESGESGPGKWKPSIHMPRWASRLTLELTDARIQRLTDLSEEDAVAEGVEPVLCGAGEWVGWLNYRHDGPGTGYLTDPVASYTSLWESLHGSGSWDVNPKIVALSFSVHRQNVDEVIGQGAAS